MYYYVLCVAIRRRIRIINFPIIIDDKAVAAVFDGFLSFVESLITIFDYGPNSLIAGHFEKI